MPHAYQGTLASIRRSVIQKVRLDEQLDKADVDTWINLAYLDAVQRTEALQKSALSPMAEGIGSYMLSEDLLVIKRIEIIYSDGTVSNPLEQITLEQMLTLRSDDTNIPQMVYNPVYALMGQTQVEVWPSPMAGQAWRWYYVYMPDALVADTDTPVIKEPFGTRLLEHGACVEAARFKKDPLLADYEQAYEYWISRYTSMQNRSNLIHQFPLFERSNVPHDPSADVAYNYR